VTNQLDDLEQLKLNLKKMRQKADLFARDLNDRGHKDYAYRVSSKSEAYSIVIGQITKMQRKKKA